jgi:hypothetical protein
MGPIRLLFLCAAAACAQDPFEIHVYEYEPLPRGAYTYEAHLNYASKGDRTLHYSSEVTGGITDHFRMAAVLLTAARPDHSLDYAGWRILPHFYAPPSWRLPFNLGLVAEFSFQKAVYTDNTSHVEIRPIVEKHKGRLEMDFNPVFERALRGPGAADGWGFSPAARVGWKAMDAFTPSIEYYGSFNEHIHQLFPGGDLRLGERLIWSFGVGFGATDVGSRLIIKSRFEFALGKRRDPSTRRLDKVAKRRLPGLLN